MSLLFVKTSILTGVVLSGYLQLPTTPPMKLGLWESSTTMTMKMPGMDMPPRTFKSRSCATAESWAKMLGSSQRTDACQRTNESFSGGHYTFDMSCPSMNGKGHADFDLSDSTATHGTVHMDMSPGGRQATSDLVVEGRFISADCGSVVPGKPELLQ